MKKKKRKRCFTDYLYHAYLHTNSYHKLLVHILVPR